MKVDHTRAASSNGCECLWRGRETFVADQERSVSRERAQAYMPHATAAPRAPRERDCSYNRTHSRNS